MEAEVIKFPEPVKSADSNEAFNAELPALLSGTGTPVASIRYSGTVLTAVVFLSGTVSMLCG